MPSCKISKFSKIQAYYRLIWYHEIAIYNIECLWDTVLTLFVHWIKRGIVHIFSLVQNRARHSYFQCEVNYLGKHMRKCVF